MLKMIVSKINMKYRTNKENKKGHHRISMIFFVSRKLVFKANHKHKLCNKIIVWIPFQGIGVKVLKKI
jgi:hypothetical protein